MSTSNNGFFASNLEWRFQWFNADFDLRTTLSFMVTTDWLLFTTSIIPSKSKHRGFSWIGNIIIKTLSVSVLWGEVILSMLRKMSQVEGFRDFRENLANGVEASIMDLTIFFLPTRRRTSSLLSNHPRLIRKKIQLQFSPYTHRKTNLICHLFLWHRGRLKFFGEEANLVPFRIENFWLESFTR